MLEFDESVGGKRGGEGRGKDAGMRGDSKPRVQVAE